LKRRLLSLLLVPLILTGCGGVSAKDVISTGTVVSETQAQITHNITADESMDVTSMQPSSQAEATVTQTAPVQTSVQPFDLSQVPEYSGQPYIVINDGKPFFTTEDLEKGSQYFVELSDLDSLGRCGSNIMSADYADEASEDRGEIGSIKPTGWVQAKYDPEQTQSDSPYLYNRCHLLAYFLTGLNAEPKNLITGTRDMNIAGQLDAIETPLADYLEANPDKHVLYRVTPEFDGNDLLAKGVLSEAESVEDNGQSFEMCIFSYNAQPSVVIDYSTGASTGPEFTGTN
jgi:DNA-entry nuclease